MKQNILSASLAILTLGMFLIPTPSHALLNDGTRGGGDEVGLEFQSAFISALREIQAKDPSLAKQIRGLNATDALIGARIMTVDTDLNIREGSIVQKSVATNDPATSTVLINRFRWNAIQDIKVKEGIALHEILSLRGAETTGQYPFSSAYLAFSGLKPDVLVTGNLHYNSPFNGLPISTDGASCQAQNVQKLLDRASSSFQVLKNYCQASFTSDQAVTEQARVFDYFMQLHADLMRTQEDCRHLPASTLKFLLQATDDNSTFSDMAAEKCSGGNH